MRNTVTLHAHSEIDDVYDVCLQFSVFPSTTVTILRTVGIVTHICFHLKTLNSKHPFILPLTIMDFSLTLTLAHAVLTVFSSPLHQGVWFVQVRHNRDRVEMGRS